MSTLLNCRSGDLPNYAITSKHRLDHAEGRNLLLQFPRSPNSISKGPGTFRIINGQRHRLHLNYYQTIQLVRPNCGQALGFAH